MEADGNGNSGGLAPFERRIREERWDQRFKAAGRDLNRVLSAGPQAPWCNSTHANAFLTTAF